MSSKIEKKNNIKERIAIWNDEFNLSLQVSLYKWEIR